MRSSRSIVLVKTLALLTMATVTLLGCGGSDYETTDDFLDSLPTDNSLEGAVGTLPPVDESMEKIAKIRVETTELDMGLIPHDALSHHKLKIYNDGQMLLKITKVDTTCACTQGEVTPETSQVPPGGSSWIDVVVDPRRIPGFHSRKVLTITSTDPENRFIEVAVTAQVDPEYSVGPEDVDLGEIAKGATLEKRIRFRQLVENPVVLKSVDPIIPGLSETTTPDFSCEVLPVPEASWEVPGHQEYEMVFTFGANMPAGPFTRYAYINTDIKRTGGHRINFTGTVMAPYAVTPQYPTRGPLVPTADGTRFQATFSFSAAVPLAIENIVPSAEQVTATVRPGTTANEVMLDVFYPGPRPQGEAYEATIAVAVIVDGKTYTEHVGVYLNPALGAPTNHDH